MERSFQVHRNAATKPSRKAAPSPMTVQSVRVTKETWDRALKEAHGDRKRIQVLSESTVIIWNSAEQKAEMTRRRAFREDAVAEN